MINLNDGILFMSDLTSAPIFLEDTEIEMSASEAPPINLNKFQTAELSFDIGYINSDLLNEVTCFDSSKPHVVEWYIPIMIQARWHKNARIRKKWLKRYGMKQDYVKATMEIDSIEFIPNPIGYNYTDDNGSMCHYNNYELTTKGMPCYHLKPHQKRKGIKIE